MKQAAQDDVVEGLRRPSTRERAQTTEQLVDGAGRPVTGHAAIENIDRVAAIVFVFWNPDRGIRMKGEYEENPDGTLARRSPTSPAGAASSLFQACQNMMLAAHALGVSSLFTTFFGLCQHEVKALLHVPPRMFLECAVFLGYGAEQLGNPRRKPLRGSGAPERLGRGIPPDDRPSRASSRPTTTWSSHPTCSPAVCPRSTATSGRASCANRSRR